MDIEKALKVLQDASVEAFRPRISETLTTIQYVGHLLEPLVTRGSETSVTSICRLCRRTSSNNISSAATVGLCSIAPNHLNENKQPATEQPVPEQPAPEQPAPEQPAPERPTPEQPEQPAAERASALLKDVIEALPSIWSLVPKEPSDIISQKRAQQRDKRLDDILRFETRKSTKIKYSPEYKFLRGTAQRSLALEYSIYQESCNQQTRVDELCDSISRPSTGEKGISRRGSAGETQACVQGRAGGIQAWVRNELAFAAEYRAIVVEAVKIGIKQLVIEKLLKQRLGHIQPSQPFLKTAAISAMTALTIQSFKALRFKDVRPFVEIILESELGPLGEDVQKSTAVQVIDKISPWFEKFQTAYDEMISADLKLESSSQKRIRLSPPLSNSGSCDDTEVHRLLAELFGNANDQSFSPPASPKSNSEPSAISNCNGASQYTIQNLSASEERGQQNNQTPNPSLPTLPVEQMEALLTNSYAIPSYSEMSQIPLLPSDLPELDEGFVLPPDMPPFSQITGIPSP